MHELSDENLSLEVFFFKDFSINNKWITRNYKS